MLKSAFFIFFCWFSLSLSAGNPTGKPEKAAPCAYTGKVLDVENLEALTGAVVKIEELGLSTYASFDGSFSFENIPAGTYTVLVEYVGYKKVVKTSVEIRPEIGSGKFLLSSI